MLDVTILLILEILATDCDCTALLYFVLPLILVVHGPYNYRCRAVVHIERAVGCIDGRCDLAYKTVGGIGIGLLDELSASDLFDLRRIFGLGCAFFKLLDVGIDHLVLDVAVLLILEILSAYGNSAILLHLVLPLILVVYGPHNYSRCAVVHIERAVGGIDGRCNLADKTVGGIGIGLLDELGAGDLLDLRRILFLTGNEIFDIGINHLVLLIAVLVCVECVLAAYGNGAALFYLVLPLILVVHGPDNYSRCAVVHIERAIGSVDG